MRLAGAARRLGTGAAAIALCCAPALADSAVPARIIGTAEVILYSVLAGIVGAAALSVGWLIRERGRIAAENAALRDKINELNGAVQRSRAVLDLRDQRIVIWPPGEGRAEIAGSLPTGSGAPDERARFLAFGRWLSPDSAAALERALAGLRRGDGPFTLVVETRSDSLLEVEGRIAAGHAIARFTSINAMRRALSDARIQLRRTQSENALLRGLLDAIPMPAWLRGEDGRLTWVNRSYAEIAEASGNGGDAATWELFGSQALAAIRRAQEANPVYCEPVSTVVSGERRLYTVTDVAGEGGSAGMAEDVTAVEAVRRDMTNLQRSHAETLDRLTTAVAIFDESTKLRFYNQAFQKLWDLDTAFLESAPDNALVMDRLRSEGKLAEQPEWRRWLTGLLEVYQAVDPQEHWWHLPDGRTLRVIANPNPHGGATWVFENLTEKIDLESRYQTALRVQGETLDNLAEGVAVFGPDGRLRLSNPAFASLWSLPQSLAVEGTHISEIRAACEKLTEDDSWRDFASAVTGFDEERRNRYAQIELTNGRILRSSLNPLPNGQIMLTFVEVTDSVNVERALKEKNEALQRADRLKDDFVQHVSYELRSPLTNIIGFTELMAMGSAGELNERQREYIDHIGTSSAVLLTIVNDILDLATVDAGIMELEIADVPVRGTIEAAASLVAERCAEHDISIAVDTDDAPATFPADGNRLRQVLYNLLVNAANYAPEGSTILVRSARVGDQIEFSVHDDGPGVPPEALQGVFKRFESHSRGSRRRGAGLGLAIVKGLVELHGGTVAIETGPGKGTTVTCRFPLQPVMREAAE